MIDWDALIGKREAVENSPPSGELPHCFSSIPETVGRDKPTNGAGCKTTSPLSPPSPLKKQGGGLDTENEARGGGGATVKFSDEKAHPVSPIAVCLLLACCRKIEADEQETVEAMLSLMRYPPSEQVRAWAMLCNENGIDPSRVRHLVIRSTGEGVGCSGCDHLKMDNVKQSSVRRVFRFVCSKQYAVLELGFVGERVLIAPPECNDYEVHRSSPPL